MPKDLNQLPRLRDSLSFLYIEHAIIEQDGLSIVVLRGEERIPVPVAAMTVLMLGPGVSVTHAAVKAICDNGCTVVWCGEYASRFYASGMGETRSAVSLLLQAKLCMDKALHLQVVKRMYMRRFPDMNCEGKTLQQIRGMEGIRVREAYRLFSKQFGVSWTKRDYKQKDWDATDPLNKALSMANAVLYSLCQAAIVSLGYSTGLGFVHTGKMLSFVYDIADLYKTETTIPAAFSVVGQGYTDLGADVRRACRKYLKSAHILKRIPEDIAWIFQIDNEYEHLLGESVGALWDEEEGSIEGGWNHAKEEYDSSDYG